MDKLDITCSILRIREVFEKCNVILLREVDPNKKNLIIGCGNGGCVDDGCVRLEDSWHNNDFLRKYINEHQHSDAITIDPLLSRNPTICAFFGKKIHDFTELLPDGSFDKIVTEGIDIQWFRPHVAKELARLANRKIPGIFRDDRSGTLERLTWVCSLVPES